MPGDRWMPRRWSVVSDLPAPLRRWGSVVCDGCTRARQPPCYLGPLSQTIEPSRNVRRNVSLAKQHSGPVRVTVAVKTCPIPSVKCA